MMLRSSASSRPLSACVRSESMWAARSSFACLSFRVATSRLIVSSSSLSECRSLAPLATCTKLGELLCRSSGFGVSPRRPMFSPGNLTSLETVGLNVGVGSLSPAKLLQ